MLAPPTPILGYVGQAYSILLSKVLSIFISQFYGSSSYMLENQESKKWICLQGQTKGRYFDAECVGFGALLPAPGISVPGKQPHGGNSS